VEYFSDSKKLANEDDSSEDPIYKCYEAVLDSKAKDETLVSLCPFFCQVKNTRNLPSIFLEKYIRNLFFVTEDLTVLN